MNKFIKIKERLKELIENQYLIIDGATGTELQKKEIKKLIKNDKIRKSVIFNVALFYLTVAYISIQSNTK